MNSIAKLCVGLAALSFILALVATFTGPLVGVPAEAFSRASTNLALIALGLFLGFKEESGTTA